MLITGLVVGSTLFFSFQATPIYESSSEVLVTPITANQQLLETVPVTSLLNLDTERRVVQSVAVATIAAQQMRSTETPRRILSKLTVEVPTNTQILRITYSEPNPLRAQQGARAFSEAYLKFKSEQALKASSRLRSGIESQIQNLESELNSVQRNLAETEPGTPGHERLQTQATFLTSRIAILQDQLTPLTTLDIDPGQILQPAELPLSPARPDHATNVGIALFVGLALGVGVAFLRERLDDRLRDRSDLEQRLGVSVLAVIPQIGGSRKRGQSMVVALEEPKSAAAEAYRTLRTGIQFKAAQEGIKTILVTSPAAGEGKSTTATNLAATLAQAGKRVVLVSADLRKPSIHRFFRIYNTVGLVDVLAGEASLRQAVKEVAKVQLLLSGPIIANPSEVLQSEQMGELLDDLKEIADFVIIDSAPILVVADSLALAPRVDGVLVIADAQATSRAAVTTAHNQLEQVGATLIGAVLNNFDPSKAKTYPYYYRYQYRYAYRPGRGGDVEPNGGLQRQEQLRKWRAGTH
ncbi:MAG: polysaccharide biosynthesis tyrosine autokinase [Actinomycetota bacterium]|nr:polysaccharide biosynthesis tyrosine autokinase [Actinomycetota bacterium]